MPTIKTALRLATCLTLMSIAAPAYANNLFLLQLGLFASEEAANSQFTQAMETHGKLLNGMRYISKKSRPINGGEITWRSLVGPYENRKLASRACAELKDSGQDCFVVETAAIDVNEVEAGSEVTAKDDEKNIVTESSRESEPTHSTPIETSSDSAWDWLSSGSKKEETSDTEQASEVEASSNSNININTHSVYAEKEEPQEAVQISLADSLSNLFSSSDSSEVADSETPEATSETAASPEIEKAEEPKSNTRMEPKVERSGEVEIAEAIPVPLTEPEDVPVTQSAPVQLTAENQPEEAMEEMEAVAEEPAKVLETVVQPEILALPATEKPAVIYSAPQRVPLTEYRRENASSRMLQVSVFENDRLAFQCLNTLQGAMPAASMLRSRIIKSTTGQAVLRLGPVNDAELENAICTSAVECGDAIQCRIIAEREIRKPLRTRDSTAKPLLNRDKRDRNAPMPRNLSPIPSSSPTASLNGPVWVQLGTSSSEADAKSKFETLQRLYPELLKEYAPTINTPENQTLGRGRVYRLRVGSFEDRSKAQALCSALSSHGIGCLVLSK